ncbi:MAG: nuclear transport factor 2 family protein [Marinicellaceae bacterium]
MQFLYTLTILLMITNQANADKSKQVADVLNNLHKAASQADSKVYFDLFTEQANFIGTDVGEYWNIDEFKAFAKPYFDKGQGWTYVPRNREIKFNESDTVAWFHEVLDNESYGTTRGTGVLVFSDNTWKISQYHLTIPIPNDLAKNMTAEIKSFESNINNNN